MLRGGFSKTVIALLPAISALVVAILVKDFSRSNGQLWFGVVFGLLLIGGVLAAIFAAKAMAVHSPNIIGQIAVFLIVLVAYVVGIGFGGCLLVFNTGLLN